MVAEQTERRVRRNPLANETPFIHDKLFLQRAERGARRQRVMVSSLARQGREGGLVAEMPAKMCL